MTILALISVGVSAVFVAAIYALDVFFGLSMLTMDRAAITLLVGSVIACVAFAAWVKWSPLPGH